MNAEQHLPEIDIIHHPRAKRLKLAVSAKGVRLTVPPFTSQRQIHFFMDQSKVWLEQTWAAQQLKMQQQMLQKQAMPLPSQLALCYSDQVFDVEYTDFKQVQSKTLFRVEQQQLLIHQDSPHQGLTQFVKQQAATLLPKQLLSYATLHQLQVNQVRIATPQTRWGSCSHDQSIMLHAGLLLMPKAYADYVLLHELAHTKHMHHQLEFWSLLEQLYPNAKKSQKEIKRFRLPHWWQTKK